MFEPQSPHKSTEQDGKDMTEVMLQQIGLMETFRFHGEDQLSAGKSIDERWIDWPRGAL